MTTAIGFTKVGNIVLQDEKLSFEAKGLFTKILSFSKKWNYSIKGLAAVCQEGTSLIRSALNELEGCRYLLRRQTVDAQGKFSYNEYVVNEEIFKNGFTKISNEILKDSNLSLKALGMLGRMLSFSEMWRYSVEGLAKVCKEGVTAIRSALKVLEHTGYIIRKQLRDASGRLCGMEYVFSDNCKKCQSKKVSKPSPYAGKPTTDRPTTDRPMAENSTQYNNIKTKNKKTKTIKHLFRENGILEQMRMDCIFKSNRYEESRQQVLANLDYPYLQQKYTTQKEQLDELVELIVETVSASRQTTRIASSDFPHKMVRQRFLKLDSTHIDFVMENLNNTTTEIRNIKQYLLAVLFNATTTISNFSAAQCNHDMNQW